MTDADRNKSACVIPLQRIEILDCDFPRWKTVIEKSKGIRIIDVYEAIHRMFAPRVSDLELNIHAVKVLEARRRARGISRGEGGSYDMNTVPYRHELLLERRWFGGLSWIEPSEKYPDGAWTILWTSEEEILQHVPPSLRR